MSEQELPYRERLALIRNGMAEKTTKAKEKKPIAKKSAKRIAKEAEEKAAGAKQVGRLELEKWFFDIQEKHWATGWCACQECGEMIPKTYARPAIAHLLPKKLFKSIATHPLNYLILGAGCGDHYKTDRVDKFSQMKVWGEAARRIKIMIPLLPFDELKYLSSQLLNALDKT